MIRHNNTTEKSCLGEKTAEKRTRKNSFNYNRKKEKERKVLSRHEKAKNSSSKGKNQFKKLSFNAVHSVLMNVRCLNSFCVFFPYVQKMH